MESRKSEMKELMQNATNTNRLIEESQKPEIKRN